MRLTRLLLPATAIALVAACLPSHADPVEMPWPVAQVFAMPVADRLAPPAQSGSSVARFVQSVPRATSDRADRVSGRQVHVVYLVGSDGADDQLDRKGVLDLSMQAMNAWFKGKTGRSWVLDTFRFSSGGRTVTAVDVTFVRAGRRGSQLIDVFAVEDELRSVNLDDREKRYLVFVAGQSGGVCGEAYFPSTSTDPDDDGQFAAVFLDADQGCGTRDFATSVGSTGWAESVSLHELMHNDGLVPITALHSCFTPSYGHLCTAELGFIASGLDPEENDVMFPFVTGPLSGKSLDRGNDDYWKVRLLPAMRDLEDSPYLTR
jgi:hypothetical protein